MVRLKNLLCILTLLFASGVAGAQTLEIAKLPDDRTVVYSRDIAPVLKKSCVACHNSSTAEGGVNLESVDKMESSDVKDVLVPGKPEASLLFLLASHADEPIMPPEDNDVSASVMSSMELALLLRWIKLGAKVDKASPSISEQMWQPLPRSLQTIYGASLTPDGRLLAAGFGNQISVFGARSTEPIASLNTVNDGSVGPAHDDFVQDLYLDPSGTRLISAGFRNVKFWELKPLQSVLIPEIRNKDVLASAINSSGSHIAVLSSRGEVTVAAIGEDRWQWMQSFDPPDAFRSEDPPQIRLAVDELSSSVVVGWGKSLRVVRRDAGEAEVLKTSHEVTTIVSRDPQNFVIGDAFGGITFFNRLENAWQADRQSACDGSVTLLLPTFDDTAPLIAIDAAGQIAKWDASNFRFSSVAKLPSPPIAGSLTKSGNAIWLALNTGAIGEFLLADKKFVEVAKTDPVAGQHAAHCKWETLVAEKMVDTTQKRMKAADEAVVAEKKNLVTLGTDIKTKVKARDEKRKRAGEAKVAAAERSKKLAVANESGEGVKAASDEATKAEKEVATKDKELSEAVAELQLSEKTRALGTVRLEALEVEAKRLKDRLNQAKVALEESKATELTAKSALDQSKTTNGVLTVIGKGDYLLSQSPTSNAWSLWSKAGDWVAQSPELGSDDELLAASRDCLVVAGSDGMARAFRPSQRVWRQQNMIGSVTGDSPFADRVLCLDVDPSERLLATGGGDPSRSGELMIWNISDGSLVQSIDAAHGDTVLDVSFSPDGRILASGSADRMIKLWDVESGALLKTLEGHTHHVNAIAWNVNRHELATGSADATVKIWDIDSGQATKTMSGLKSEVTDLVFIGRDDRIGIVCGDGQFRVYRTDNGAQETNAKLTGGYLYALDANREGTQFIIAGTEGTATLVDRSGKQRQQFRRNHD